MAMKGLHTDLDKDDSEDSDEASEQDDSASGTKIPINPVPVAMKSPSIVTYKIIKQGERGVYQIVREDGTDIVYINFGAMLKDITRDDLTELYRIVMNRYGMNGPEDELEKVCKAMLDKKLQGGKPDENCYKMLKMMEKQAGIRNPPCLTDIRIASLSEQTALGKDFSNPLMADNLPKIVWLSTHHIWYGYINNHKKTVKNGQTRTRESEERKRSQRLKAKAKKSQKVKAMVNLQSTLDDNSSDQQQNGRVNYVKSSTLIGSLKPHGLKEAQEKRGFALIALTKEAHMSLSRIAKLAIRFYSVTLNSLRNEDKVFKPGILVYHAIHDKIFVTLEENLKENISSGSLLIFKEPSFLLPPPEPPDESLKNVVFNFYQSKKTLPLYIEDVNTFAFVIWTFLPYFTYIKESSLIFSFRSENFVFDPGIITFHKPVAVSMAVSRSSYCSP
ncbi:hypothetical protein Tco_1108317 [Tanacetum coccineum]